MWIWIKELFQNIYRDSVTEWIPYHNVNIAASVIPGITQTMLSPITSHAHRREDRESGHRAVRKSTSSHRVTETPISTDKRRFFCREWAFQKIAHCLEQRPVSKTCGALILGMNFTFIGIQLNLPDEVAIPMNGDIMISVLVIFTIPVVTFQVSTEIHADLISGYPSLDLVSCCTSRVFNDWILVLPRTAFPMHSTTPSLGNMYWCLDSNRTSNPEWLS